MAEISAQLVRTLRERTGAGMMDCKKYLVKAEGSLEKAEELMRKDGSKAEKKAGRTTAEGQVQIATNATAAAIVEVNSETDFVAKGDDFTNLVQEIANTVLAAKTADLDTILSTNLNGSNASVADSIKNVINKLGENIQLRRVQYIDAADAELGQYLHGTKIGVLVHMQGGDAELAKDIAMHIAAASPTVVNPEDVDSALLDKEKEIFTAQAQSSGKPAEIISKMVEGRIKKFLNEVSLVGQPFVKDPNTTVAKLLASKQASVNSFVRFEVGEGIEKKVEDFAKEVEMAKKV